MGRVQPRFGAGERWARSGLLWPARLSSASAEFGCPTALGLGESRAWGRHWDIFPHLMLFPHPDLTPNLLRCEVTVTKRILN